MYDYYDEFDLIDNKLASIDSRLDHLSQAMVSGDYLIIDSIQVQQAMYNNSHQSILLLSCILIVVFIFVLSSFLPKRKGVFKK